MSMMRMNTMSCLMRAWAPAASALRGHVRCASGAGDTRSLHILAITGSLRSTSCNTGLLRTCAKKLPPNVTMEIFVPDLPLFNQDLEAGSLPASVLAFQEKAKKADAYIFATPEYNFSVTAAMKNALDWGTRGGQTYGQVFNDKPALLVSAAGGVGGLRSQMHFRDIALFLNLHIMGEPGLMVKIFEKPMPFNMATGDLVDEALDKRAGEVVAAFIKWCHRVKPSA